MAKDTGGSAFPQLDYRTPDRVETSYPGMSLRDYFAAKAMQSIIAASKNITVGVGEETTNLNIAYASFSLADSMLKARNA